MNSLKKLSQRGLAALLVLSLILSLSAVGPAYADESNQGQETAWEAVDRQSMETASLGSDDADDAETIEALENSPGSTESIEDNGAGDSIDRAADTAGTTDPEAGTAGESDDTEGADRSVSAEADAADDRSGESETVRTEEDDRDYEQVPIITTDSALEMARFVGAEQEYPEEALSEAAMIMACSDDPEAYEGLDPADFAAMSLIVLDDDLQDTAGASSVLYYEKFNEYILQFDSIEDTMAGYEILMETYDESNCFPDELIDTEDIEFEEAESLESWGTDYSMMYTLKTLMNRGNYPDVTIAVLDTGLDSSQDEIFNSRINEYSYDFINDTDELTDVFGHGTNCASIILDATPDNMDVMVLRTYTGLSKDNQLKASYIASVILYAYEHGATVMNFSWTFGSGSTVIPKTALIPLSQEGVIFVAAAGNYSQPVSNYFPANDPRVITVSGLRQKTESELAAEPGDDGEEETEEGNESGEGSGTGTDDEEDDDDEDDEDEIVTVTRAEYSNYGSGLDLCAPGTDIPVVGLRGRTVNSGTSFAAPLVCAIMACYVSLYPDLPSNEYYAGDTDQEAYLAKAAEDAIDLGDEGWDIYYGYGAINASVMVQTLLAEQRSGISDDPYRENTEIPLKRIFLNEKELTVGRGKQVPLEIIYVPSNTTADKTVTWEIEDTDVVSLNDEGQLMAVGKGTTTVTATVGDYSASCEVTVVILLESISLSETTKDLVLWDSYLPTLSYLPADADEQPEPVWTSSDRSVLAPNNDGTFTAVGAGTAVLTAVCGDCSAVCEVTVTAYPLEKIVMSESTLEVALWDVGQLTVSYFPENTTDDQTITWSSSDPELVYVDEEGYFFAMKEGTAVITAVCGDARTQCRITAYDEKEYLIRQFVRRLYKVCLGRNPDEKGLTSWTGKLKTGSVTGIGAAYGFIFSDEFKNKNLCNEDYVEQLYQAFLGRAADASGKATWVKKLETGTSREAVFNGFALSAEFTKLCSDYGILRGLAISLPAYGTVPKGACTVCGKEDGVTAFVTRLYTLCLDRKPDAAGLASWTAKLWSHQISGSTAASGFFFSSEFTGKQKTDAEYVEILYRVMLGRGSDASGKASWVKKLQNGMSRRQVFQGFVKSQEFSAICLSYGISRD